MKYPNIGRQPGKSGYIGYTAEGFARRIEKTNSSFGSWIAWPHRDEGMRAIPMYAFTLKSMSARLAAAEEDQLLKDLGITTEDLKNV